MPTPSSSQTPTWARPRGGPPEPGSALDDQFAAFIGPRWARYRRKFGPFFDEARFQPTWNWGAALFVGGWFLYRKLYVPFVFFAIVPSIAFTMLIGDAPQLQTVPDPRQPAGPPLTTLTPDAQLLLVGVYLSTVILAGGTANYLLFRRASAAIHLLAPRAPDAATRIPLLRRVGGVSWMSVAVGFGVMLLLQLLASGTASGR
jgi:hypothetical protein